METFSESATEPKLADIPNDSLAHEAPNTIQERLLCVLISGTPAIEKPTKPYREVCWVPRIIAVKPDRP
jgi:hypothetical protein